MFRRKLGFSAVSQRPGLTRLQNFDKQLLVQSQCSWLFPQAGLFEVDLRNNPDQSKGPVNTTRDGVMVSCQMLFKSLTDPYSPANEGSFRPIRLLTREGSVFHVKEPGPIGFYYEIELRVYDLMWRCLAAHIPQRLASGHFASVCGTFIGGIHPDTGRQYTIIEPQIGGWAHAKGPMATARCSAAFTARPITARPRSTRHATA